ncbi:hypothetical protein PCS80_20975 [Escherichia coli]|nr:hypothetical protein [Escherichia coli]WMO36306.1 hypothetical protein PCS80_20975 [Escherichia coli]
MIDKKVYETWITLAGEVWKLMFTLIHHQAVAVKSIICGIC